MVEEAAGTLLLVACIVNLPSTSDLVRLERQDLPSLRRQKLIGSD